MCGYIRSLLTDYVVSVVSSVCVCFIADHREGLLIDFISFAFD